MRDGMMTVIGSPFYLTIIMVFVVVLGVAIWFQINTPGPATVAGGGTGCAIGKYAGGVAGCIIGGGIGAVGANAVMGETTVGAVLRGTRDVRATALYPQLLLRYRLPSDDLPIGTKLRRYLICDTYLALPDPPYRCDTLENTFESTFRIAAETVIPPWRQYEISVRYRGEERVSAASSPDVVYQEGPAAYTTQIAMPGGTTATYTVQVEGTSAGVRWER